MRPFFFRSFFCAAALVFVSSAAPAGAGRLDLAIVQFSGIIDAGAINSALEGEDLGKAAWGDRLEVRDRRLRGIPVLYAQTLGVAGGAFRGSTRIGAQRAELEGSIAGGRIEAEVALSEGMEAALRRYSRKVYRGSAELVTGPPRVLGIRQVDHRQPSVVKGKSKMVANQSTVALLYQFRN